MSNQVRYRINLISTTYQKSGRIVALGFLYRSAFVLTVLGSILAACAVFAGEDPILGLDGQPVDPLAEFEKQHGETEDFKAVRNSVQKSDQQRKANPISDDERVSNELKQLRDAESKQRAADEAQIKAERDAERKRSREERIRQEKEMEALRSQVQKDVDSLPGVTDEELRWDGLRD